MEHALIVAYGRFGRQVGLISAIEGVPFSMKTVQCSAADKVIELLCHILAGGVHINELGKSAHPPVQDQAVAHAWGQPCFASSSGVSQLLHSISNETADALTGALRQIIASDRCRMLSALSARHLGVDFDLTGLVVSDRAMTYEGADFGHVGRGRGDNAIAHGYQFARIQMMADKDVLVLGGFLNPGRIVAVRCLAEMIALTEPQLGRPHHRVEAVEACLAEAQQEVAVIEAELAKLATKGKAGRVLGLPCFQTFPHFRRLHTALRDIPD